MSKPANLNEPLRKVILSRVVTGILGLAVFTWAWFGIAGRVTWWQGWAFLLTFIIYVSILVWHLSKLNPELVRERNRPADKAEAWDRVVMGIYAVILVVLLIVSALDGGRYGRNNWPRAHCLTPAAADRAAPGGNSALKTRVGLSLIFEICQPRPAAGAQSRSAISLRRVI